MVQIIWTKQAVFDLKEIFNYISKDSFSYAKHEVLRIKSRTEVLKSNPNIGRITPKLNRQDIKQLVQGKYRIIYKVVNENRIDILSIHHSSRDLGQRTIV